MLIVINKTWNLIFSFYFCYYLWQWWIFSSMVFLLLVFACFLRLFVWFISWWTLRSSISNVNGDFINASITQWVSEYFPFDFWTSFHRTHRRTQINITRNGASNKWKTTTATENIIIMINSSRIYELDFVILREYRRKILM